MEIISLHGNVSAFTPPPFGKIPLGASHPSPPSKKAAREIESGGVELAGGGRGSFRCVEIEIAGGARVLRRALDELSKKLRAVRP